MNSDSAVDSEKKAAKLSKQQKTRQSTQQGNYLFTPFEYRQIPEIMAWFNSAHDVILWSGFKFKYPFNQETFSAQLRLKEIAAFSLLDEDSGQVLGFGQLMYDQGRCHLVRIAVNPARRKQGHGELLVKSLCYQGYKQFKVQSFSLFVNKHNQAAFKLYRKLGFEISEYDGPMPNDVSWYMQRIVYSAK